MLTKGANNWYVRTEDGKVYGPAPFSSLLAWVKGGRILASSQVSRDLKNWTLAPAIPEFEMHWLVELAPGQVYGPFNRALVIQAFKDRALPKETTKFYRLHPYTPDYDPPRFTFSWPWKKEQKASERIFGNMSREQLIALEAAAQKEVARSREYSTKRQLGTLQRNLIERKV